MAKIVAIVRPTLGPRPRLVAVAPVLGDGPAELLDDAAALARRIVELPDRDEDVGAMLVRNMLWRVHEQAGDGAASAAVVFEAVLEQGYRYIASGLDPVRLRRRLEEGVQVVLRELATQAVPVSGRDSLAAVAAAACPDVRISRLLGEIFDIVGVHGQIEVAAGAGREPDREYTEGSQWPTGVLAREMLADLGGRQTTLQDAAVLATDFDIAEPNRIAPLVELALREQVGALLIIAAKLSGAAVTVLLANRSDALRIVAVRTPGLGPHERSDALHDVAALTGARALLTAAGDTPERVATDDLGRVRRSWADRDHFGFAGGRGDARELRRYLAKLRDAENSTDDQDGRRRLRDRIGRLMGGSATLTVGGATLPDVAARKAQAERAAETVRGALREGVVPGGGAALLACRPELLRRRDKSQDPEERAAYYVLAKALEAPTRAIVANAGFEPALVLAEIERCGRGAGYDVSAGKVVHMATTGVLDSASVVRVGVQTAVSSAALALTIGSVVHRRKREESMEP